MQFFLKIVAPVIVVLLSMLMFVPKTYAGVEFTLSNAQSDGTTVTFDVTISGLASNSCLEGKCYLQAAFRQGNSNYFGLTQNNNGEFYQYESKPGKDNIKSNYYYFEPTNGSWQGSLTSKVDPEASGYKGPGTYDLKALRFSGNSDSSTSDSDNNLVVELTAQKPSNEDTSSSDTNSTIASRSDFSAKSPSPTPKSSPKIISKKSPSPTPKILGQATESTSSSQNTGNTTIENSIAQTNPNEFSAPSPLPQIQTVTKKTAGLLMGSGLALIGLSTGGLIWYKKQEGKPSIQHGKEQYTPREKEE